MHKQPINDGLVSNLTNQQLDELLAYVPAFSEENLANIKTRMFEKINSAPEEHIPTGKSRISIKKTFAVMAAAIMLLATSTAVFATVTDFDFGHFFNSMFNNPAAVNLMDIGQSVEVDGIKITVVSAYAVGNEVYAMLEIRDLYESRIGEDIALWSHRYADAHVFVSTPVIYCEAEESALVGVFIWGFNDIEIGADISFSIENVLTGFWAGDEIIDFPLYMHALEREMVPFEQWGGMVTGTGQINTRVDGFMSCMAAKLPEYLLIPGQMYKYLPGIDGIIITNIGFYNNMLHIQTRLTDAWNSESNTSPLHFRIIDSYGNTIYPAVQLFVGDTRGYVEHLFNIGAVENLTDMHLAFWGIRYDSIISGPWQFDFPITAHASKRYITLVPLDSEYFNHIRLEIMPMATFVRLFSRIVRECDDFFEQLSGYVNSFGAPFMTLNDGRVIEMYSGDSSFFSRGGWAKYTTLYFDVSELYSITILGVEHRICYTF